MTHLSEYLLTIVQIYREIIKHKQNDTYSTYSTSYTSNTSNTSNTTILLDILTKLDFLIFKYMEEIIYFYFKLFIVI